MNKFAKGGIIAGIVLVVGIILSFMFIERVPEGKVAVVYTPSGGASEVLDPGWHMIGLFEKTQQYPTRITIVEDKLSVTTNDGKKLTMPTTYEMKVDASKVLGIFKELGSQDVEAIQEGYLHKQLFQAARETVSSYSVLDIYGTEISKASSEVTERMARNTEKLGFLVSDVILGTPKVDAATQQAIDARVQAAQQLEKLNLDKQIAESEAEKKRIEAEGEKQKLIIEAQASSEAALIKAQKQAEANRVLNESLTENVLKRMELEARLKHGWVEVQTGQAIVDANQ